jgi:hypothetical protein
MARKERFGEGPRNDHFSDDDRLGTRRSQLMVILATPFWIHERLIRFASALKFCR